MKTTVVALSGLTAVVVSFAAGIAGGGKAAAPTSGVQSIGVINLMEILRPDRTYADEIVSDTNKARAELEEMSTRIVTQKVLYCDGCLDITQDVQAKLSTAKP